MSLLDPFESLPYDKMIEICENLDTETLGQLTQTSKNAYQTCQWILSDRMKESKKEILGKLIGVWKVCIEKRMRDVVIKLVPNRRIVVFHSTKFETLLSDMDIRERGEFFAKYIDLDDILELKKLYRILLGSGYKKISRDEIYATKYNLRGIIFHMR